MKYLSNRLFTFIVFLAVAIAIAAAPSFAQGGGNPLDNKCDCTVNVTYNVDICIAGTTYNANVKFCEANYNVPYPNGNCDDTRGQNRKSVMKEICFTGAYPAGSTQRTIIGALYCQIRSTGCQIPSPYGFTVPNNGVYCWELALPKCTRRVLNCVIACEECKYCTYALVWRSINGNCVLQPDAKRCDDGPCQGGLCDETGDCPEPVCCQ